MICYHCQEQFRNPKDIKIVLTRIGRVSYCKNCIIDLTDQL
jgi:hypothetical protein